MTTQIETMQEPSVQKPTNIKKKLFGKKHIQGFIAGFLTAAILFTGVLTAVNPKFLTGSVIDQATIVRYKMFPNVKIIPDGNSDIKYVTELSLFTFATSYPGFLPCDGRGVSLSSNITLCALLSSEYTFNLPESEFGLPDLSNKFSDPSLKYYISYYGRYPQTNGRSNATTISDINYLACDVSYYASDKDAAVRETYMGEIVLLKVSDESSISSNFVPCEGQALKVSNNQALAYVLSVPGNAATFSIPDLRNLSPIPGAKFYISIRGTVLPVKSIPPGYVECQKCGSVVADGAFCSNCGTRLK